MLKFSLLYVGLRKTINDIFELVGEKKIGRGKNWETPRNFKLLDQSSDYIFEICY